MNMNSYFSGDKLYGNDFDETQIREWYADEKEGYAGLGSNQRNNYEYGYHILNQSLGYCSISKKELDILAVGAAYGDEIIPIRDRVKSLIVLDPSDSFEITNSIIKNICWIKPNPTGVLEFDDCSFDLVTCFGVLHHIPNVEFVLKEIGRVLRVGGTLILREPIVSMGDWTQPRQGLTKRERGIPRDLLVKYATGDLLSIISKHYVMFTPLVRLIYKMGYRRSMYNSRPFLYLDIFLCWLFSFQARRYHRKRILEKIAPSGLFLVLRK